MAVTAIWDVKGEVGAVIKYTANPSKTWNGSFGEAAQFHAVDNVIQYTSDEIKTEQQLFVTGVNCSSIPKQATEQFIETKKAWSKEGGIVCFHGYQAFKPGEVTPELAHKIGVELAKQLWGDRFEVLVSTHLNTGKIHNHFALNSISYVDGLRYYDQKKTYHRMRELSDNLCREYGLSIITEPKGKKRHIAEVVAEREGRPTKRQLIRGEIDSVLERTNNFRDFCREIQNDGFVLECRGSFLRIREDRGSKFFRLDRLGDGYSEVNIREKLKANYLNRPRTPRPRYVPPKREKAQGLKALYYYYRMLLKNLPQSRPDSKTAYAVMREDSMRMKKYSDEAKLLAKYNIITADDLHNFTESLGNQFKSLAYSRAILRNKLRRMHDSDEMLPIKQQIAEITDQMAELRKQMKLCEDVALRSGAVETVVNTIEREQTEKDKAENQEKQNDESKSNNKKEHDVK